MIPLTVVIGVGGMGSSVAVRVQKHLRQLARERDRAQKDSFEESEIARNTRIFAIDTRPDAPGLGSGNKYNIAPQQVDDTLHRRLAPVTEGGNALFQQWWPPERQTLGPFLEGAGAIRIKGKFAFYEEGWSFADDISDAINSLLNVSAMMPTGSPPVFVFIVGSLSGGTGSGMILPLALHLRQKVTNSNVLFIGGIPLGSIMRKAPARAFENMIWGNCSAGLRELEWWMTPKSRRPIEIRPFLQKGQDAILGDASPFDLCYLFTENNRATRQVGLQFDDYANLIADAIALDVNSDAAAHSQGSLSNFILKMTMNRARPPLQPGDDPAKVACKPVTFGSVGAASLEYPANSVAQYLGFRLLDTALGAYLLRDVDGGSTARDWAASQAEPRLTPDALNEALRVTHTDQRTRQQTVSQKPRPLPTEGVDRRQVVAESQRAQQNFERNTLPQLERVIALNAPLVDAAAHAALWQRVDTLLTAPTGDGFALARRFIGDVRSVIAGWQTELLDALNAHLPDNKQFHAERFPTATRDLMQSQAQSRSNELKKALEGAVVGGAAVRSAIERFNRSWWQPYTQAREQVALQTAVVARYGVLLKTLDTMQEAVETMVRTLSEARQRNVRDARTILGGRNDRVMMLEERVLNDAELVELVFGEQLATERLPGEGSPVAALARTMTIGTDETIGLIRVLHAAAGPRPLGALPTDVKAETTNVSAHGADYAADRFRPHVEALSIWEALKHEAVYRYRNNLRDPTLNLIAPPGTYLSDSELARRYIEQRVKHCLETAEPSWNLDVARLDQTTFPIERDGLIWYSSDSLRDLPEDEADAIVRTVDVLASRLGLRAHSDVGSRHRILAMQREAGATLFMLDPAEQAKCYEGERLYEAQNGSAYGDRRFVDVLPSDFELSSVQAIIDGNAKTRPQPRSVPPMVPPTELDEERIAGNGQVKVPETYFEFMDLLDTYVEKGILTAAARAKAIDRFGEIRDRLDKGKMTQETYEREVRMYLARLMQPQPAQA